MSDNDRKEENEYDKQWNMMQKKKKKKNNDEKLETP